MRPCVGEITGDTLTTVDQSVFTAAGPVWKSAKSASNPASKSFDAAPIVIVEAVAVVEVVSVVSRVVVVDDGVLLPNTSSSSLFDAPVSKIIKNI